MGLRLWHNLADDEAGTVSFREDDYCNIINIFTYSSMSLCRKRKLQKN